MTLIIQWLAIIAVWGIPMIAGIMIYKRKAKGGISYWKSFLIALSVFGVISIMGIAGTSIMRFIQDGFVAPLNHLMLIGLRMLGIGIVSSLVAAALFRIINSRFWKKNEKIPLG